MTDVDLTGADEAQLLANTHGVARARVHLAIARRAALERRLVAAETHILAAAVELESGRAADLDKDRVGDAATEPSPHRDGHPAAAALRQIVDTGDPDREFDGRRQVARVFSDRQSTVSTFASGIGRVAADQEWVLAHLPHRILRGQQRAGFDPRTTDMLAIDTRLEAARSHIEQRSPRAAARELHDAATGLGDLAHPGASRTTRDAALRIERGGLNAGDEAFYATFVDEAREALMSELQQGPAAAPWPASVLAWPIRDAVGDLVEAHELLDRDQPASAARALASAVAALQRCGARPEFADELGAWLDDIDSDRRPGLLAGSTADAYRGRRDVDVLLGELDALAVRHGLDGDVRSQIDLRHAYLETDHLENVLAARMQNMRIGDELVLPNGTLVTQDERGYIVDATRRVGVDAGDGAMIAVGCDARRASVARSDAGSTLAYGAERLRTAGALLANDEVADARAAADTAVGLLAGLEHPAAARIAALAEHLRPESIDAHRDGVVDALRVEWLRLTRDADFLQDVIVSPETAAGDCRSEEREQAFLGPQLHEAAALPASVIDRHDAWRRDVIARERAERQRAVRARGFSVHPPSPAAELVDLDAEHVVVQLTVARDLLTHDDVDGARTAVDVAVTGLEQSGERRALAAELDAWAADFAPFDEMAFEHPTYELPKHAEILLADLDAISARHDVRIDLATSTGDLQPATLSAEFILERRMNRMQVGEHLTLPNGAQLARDEYLYVIDAQPIGAYPPVAARAAVHHDAAREQLGEARSALQQRDLPSASIGLSRATKHLSRAHPASVLADDVARLLDDVDPGGQLADTIDRELPDNDALHAELQRTLPPHDATRHEADRRHANRDTGRLIDALDDVVARHNLAVAPSPPAAPVQAPGSSATPASNRDARSAKDIAGLCQAHPPRHAAAGPPAAGTAPAAARIPTARHVDRGVGR